jgi:hypothetical protein
MVEICPFLLVEGLFLGKEQVRGVGTHPSLPVKICSECARRELEPFVREGVDRNPYIVCIYKQLTDELFAVTNVYEVDVP